MAPLQLHLEPQLLQASLLASRPPPSGPHQTPGTPRQCCVQTPPGRDILLALLPTQSATVCLQPDIQGLPTSTPPCPGPSPQGVPSGPGEPELAHLALPTHVCRQT